MPQKREVSALPAICKGRASGRRRGSLVGSRLALRSSPTRWHVLERDRPLIESTAKVGGEIEFGRFSSIRHRRRRGAPYVSTPIATTASGGNPHRVDGLPTAGSTVGDEGLHASLAGPLSANQTRSRLSHSSLLPAAPRAPQNGSRRVLSSAHDQPGLGSVATMEVADCAAGLVVVVADANSVFSGPASFSCSSARQTYERFPAATTEMLIAWSSGSSRPWVTR